MITSSLKVICPNCERDLFFLERVPLIGEPFIFFKNSLDGKIMFCPTADAQCPRCWAFIMIPKNGGYKVLTNKGLVP